MNWTDDMIELIIKLSKFSDEIINETNNPNVIVHHIDLASFQSVRQFAQKIIETEPKIDILIHNAGVSNYFKKQVSPDGVEITMSTNHYSPFLLTHLLMDHLVKMNKVRIVVVASKTHSLSYLDPTKKETLNPINNFPMNIYANSKFANILFTIELARRLKAKQIKHVTVNCLHPGVIQTDIWRNQVKS